MDKPIYFIGEKIYDPTIKENLTTKINQIKNKIDINNEDYKILLKEINNYNKPKLLTYGNNSLLNILKSPKEGKKLLFENTYGILANLLYKYKDNLDINIYEYIHLVDKQTIINKIKLGNSNYFLQILSQDEIDIDILKEMIYNEPELLAKININPNNKILTEVLKQRYQVYFQNEEYYFNLKNTKEFYKHLINNKIFNIKEYSLSNVIDIIIKSNKKEYNIYLKCSLIAPLFKYIKNNSDWNNNLNLMLKLCREDPYCYKYAHNNIKSNENLIFTVFNNKDKKNINEDIIVENIKEDLINDLEFNNKLIDKLQFYHKAQEFLFKPIITDRLKYLEIFKNNINLNKNKELTTKLIFKTPKSFKYIDKSLIDESMIDYLLQNFKYNKNNIYYSNFYNDIRFIEFYSQSDPKIVENPQNIVSIISKYIHVVKAGPNSKDYKAICPFHDDHNPSLRISPNKGVFTCFSCGVSGNANKFVRLFNNEKDTSKYRNFKISKTSIYKKNRFYYYLYTNLPIELKTSPNIIKKFLEIDGCILKLVPKELKYNKDLVEIAMNQDISSFRYIMNNKEYKDKYLKEYPILNYYLPKEEKSKEYKEQQKKILSSKIEIKRKQQQLFDPFEVFGDTVEISNDDLPF